MMKGEFSMSEDLFRKKINKELLHLYDASTGFNLEDLDAFRVAAHAAEYANIKEDSEVKSYDRFIQGPADNPELKVRIYEPINRTDEALPVVLFFHGGGFVFGTHIRQNDMCNRYCKNVNCVVMSVEYRLAPEFKAPKPVEDCYAALVWAAENAKELNIDPDRIALVGVSAGGTMVAATALMARDRKGPQPVVQMPLYAELDYTMSTATAQGITNKKVWSYPYSIISWEHYLEKGKEVDYYTSPSLAEDLSGLPPLFSYIGGVDPFLDENLAYWERLMHAGGIDVEFHVYPGCFHAFETSAPDSTYGKQAYEATYAALRKAFDK